MIPTFLFSLAAGMMIVLATARPSEISWKFLRLCGFLTLGLLVAASTMVYRDTLFLPDQRDHWVIWCGGVGALAGVLNVLLSPLAHRWAIPMRALWGAGGLAALIAGTALVCAAQRGGSQMMIVHLLSLLDRAAAAMLLGSITVAWLLGHAYLTATKMTMAPLRHFSRVLSRAVVMRSIFVVVSFGIAAALGPSSPDIFARLGNAWIIVLLHVGVGLLLVGLFAYMVADCVRLRATQSATGILYFGSLCAYVGELAAQHLSRELAWPL